MLQLSQRPLMATTADAEMFVGRTAELDKLSRAIRHGFNSLVLGDRGAGKTSLLRRLEMDLLSEDVDCWFVDAGRADTVLELIRLVAEPGGVRASPLFLADEDDLVANIRALSPDGDRQTVVLLDNTRSPSLVQHLFGRLRDEVWQLPFLWVVSGNRSDRTRYLEPPADTFFDAVVQIGELDEEAAGDLLRRRALRAGPEDENAAVLLDIADELAAQVTPRTPRNLLAAARDVFIAGDPAGWVKRREALNAGAAEVGPAAEILFREVVDLGPVSPSDERLLDRLGWSRSRASQVFRQLQDANLVVATEEAAQGPGRPRKLYAVNTSYPPTELSKDR